MDSISHQTLTDWECIIVNDGSTDNSEEVILSLAAKDDRIIYVSQPNKGPSGARNRALDEIRGKYVQFIDADDIIADNKIELQVSELSRSDELAVAYCDFQWYDESGQPIDVTWKSRAKIDQADPLRDVLLNWQTEIQIPPSCFLFDARFFTEHNVREDESIRANEDYDLLARVFALKPKLFFQDRKLAGYRIVPGSVSKDHARLRRTYFHMLDKLGILFAQDLEMLAILREKRRVVKRDYWSYAPPYEWGWWKFRIREISRRILSSDDYQRLKRVLRKGS